MKLYKIKHKPTGLYYQPQKGNGHFSKTGKVYHRKPTFKQMNHYLELPRDFRYYGKITSHIGKRFLEAYPNIIEDKITSIDFIEEDWEIIELTIK